MPARIRIARPPVRRAERRAPTRAQAPSASTAVAAGPSVRATRWTTGSASRLDVPSYRSRLRLSALAEGRGRARCSDDVRRRLLGETNAIGNPDAVVGIADDVKTGKPVDACSNA